MSVRRRAEDRPAASRQGSLSAWRLCLAGLVGLIGLAGLWPASGLAAVLERSSQGVAVERREQQGGRDVPTPVPPVSDPPAWTRPMPPGAPPPPLVAPAVSAAAAQPDPAGMAGAVLARGWRAFEQGRFPEAMRLFRDVWRQGSPRERQDGQLGFVLAALKSGQGRLADPAATALEAAGCQTAAFLPAFVEYLIDSGQFDRAEPRLARLPADRRDAALARLAAGQGRAGLAQARAGRLEPLVRFAETGGEARRRCLSPWSFVEAADELARQGRLALAETVLTDLAPCAADDVPLRHRVTASLAELRPGLEGLARLRAGQGGGQPASRLLAEAEERLLRLELDRLDPASPAAEGRARELLVLRPGDVRARGVLAWAALNGGRAREARDLFRDLVRDQADDETHLLGLAYAQERLGEPEAVLAWAARPELADGRRGPDWRRLRVSALAELGGRSLAAGDLPQAEARLAEARRLAPERGELSGPLAWALYRQGKRAEALPFFEESLAVQPEAGAAEALLSIKADQAGQTAAFARARRMIASGQPPLVQAAAAFYASHGAPVMAAQTANLPGSAWQDADKPWLRAEGGLCWRDGERGLTALQTARLGVRQTVPLAGGQVLRFGLEERTYDAGRAPDKPFAGSFYRALDGRADNGSLVTSRTTAVPAAGLTLEGPTRFDLDVGTTPLGGPVAPLATVEARVTRGAWSVEVHNRSVEETMLSAVGQKDPYGDKTWGRVTAAGLSAGWDPAWGPWWLSLRAGADRYRGRGVPDNDAWKVTAALGRTIPAGRVKLSPGLFASVGGFQKNLGGQTLGQGGYFSPASTVMAGPLLGVEAGDEKTWRIKADLAGGYMRHRTESAPLYHGLEGAETLSEAARAAAQATTPGKTTTGLGYSASLEASRMIGDKLELGLFAQASNATDYSEYAAGLRLTWTFGQASPRVR